MINLTITFLLTKICNTVSLMKHTWCFCNIRIDILKELDTVGRFLDYKNILETEKLDGFILEKTFTLPHSTL